ncbi:zf-TFIIB domain-containing protein [Halobacteria archaeon AArc-dxtr1]|nr:zf-TFIIB domain-containing protein [Halobacteria archaeon AArc-dxtr1]
MDDCPRCSAQLERMSLGEVTTIACPRCGYADVPVEHLPEGRENESWHDALHRFYEDSEKSP